MTDAQPGRQAITGKRRTLARYQPRSVRWGACYAPSPSVRSSVQDREAVLVNLDNGRQYTLNPVATAVWELLDGRRPLATVLTALSESFDAPESRLRRDLGALVAQLLSEFLIAERK